jgi:hypothetical protein
MQHLNIKIMQIFHKEQSLTILNKGRTNNNEPDNMVLCRKVIATSESEVSKMPRFSEESNLLQEVSKI